MATPGEPYWGLAARHRQCELAASTSRSQGLRAWVYFAKIKGMRTKGNEYSDIAARHALVALRYSVAFRARVAPCQHSGSSSQMACAKRVWIRIPARYGNPHDTT